MLMVVFHIYLKVACDTAPITKVLKFNHPYIPNSLLYPPIHSPLANRVLCSESKDYFGFTFFSVF